MGSCSDDEMMGVIGFIIEVMFNHMAVIHVGLVGTGYAARKRAEAFTTDGRSHLVAVWGSRPERVQSLCETYGAVAAESYQALVTRPDIDLVVISTMNHLHGAIATAAINAQKHVVVEYPLALDVNEATAIIQLAHHHQKLLHVEHIELLSGIHQAVVTALPNIRTPFYVQSTSLRAEPSVSDKWSYYPDQVGFPLVGALSRLQRLVNAFGNVSTVSCHRSCLCSAQLRFASGLVADVVYGKGVDIWTTERSLHIHGEAGMIHLEGDRGHLLTADGQSPLTIGSRRGLFARDNELVLDALTTGAPLYVTPAQSLYALTVADAARRSALGHGTVSLHPM